MAESLPSPFAPSRLPASADSPNSTSHPGEDLSGAGAEILEALLQPRISLFWGAQAPTRSLLTAATTIAAGGLPVRLFDGGRKPQSLVKERWLLLDQLQAAADAAWMLRPPPAEPVLQPRLF